MEPSPAGANANEPVTTEVPVLLIGGDYDPNTPPKWARQRLGRAPNGWRFEFPGWGHSPTTNWSVPCAQQIVAGFLRQPQVKPEAPCFDELAPTKFVTP